MVNSTISDVDKKFSDAENAIEMKLKRTLVRDEIQWQHDSTQSYPLRDGNHSMKCKTLELASQRNAGWLKDMEMVRAKLRSHRTFSPLEMVLKKAIANYRRSIDTTKSV